VSPPCLGQELGLSHQSSKLAKGRIGLELCAALKKNRRAIGWGESASENC